MADITHDDPLAEVFTQFRSLARQEIRPPGPGAVRRAARRRRTVRAACAGVVVAAVATVVGLVATGGTSASPPLSAAQLEHLADQALDALGRTDGAYSTAVTAQTPGKTYPFGHEGSSPMQWVKGQDYDLVAQCMGQGSVTVAWQPPGGPPGSVRVVCGRPTVLVHFVPGANGPVIQVTLTPDAEAIGRAGIAVSILET